MNRRLRKVYCLTVLVMRGIGLLAIAGCDGGRAFVVKSGPDVTNPVVNPTQLARFVGGQVVISAVVQDESGIKKVTARIVRQSDGQLLANVTLQRVRDDRFEVTITAPPNTRSDGQSEVYTVTIIAINQEGQKTKIADGTFEVPPPPVPPAPPNP